MDTVVRATQVHTVTLKGTFQPHMKEQHWRHDFSVLEGVTFRAKRLRGQKHASIVRNWNRVLTTATPVFSFRFRTRTFVTYTLELNHTIHRFFVWNSCLFVRVAFCRRHLCQNACTVMACLCRKRSSLSHLLVSFGLYETDCLYLLDSFKLFNWMIFFNHAFILC